MNPYNLIHNNKYHKDAIVFLCESIINIYKQSLVNGEMVGIKVLANPRHRCHFTDEHIRIVKRSRGTNENKAINVTIGQFCDSIIQKNSELSFQ